jgi:hypothetical protein
MNEYLMYFIIFQNTKYQILNAYFRYFSIIMILNINYSYYGQNQEKMNQLFNQYKDIVKQFKKQFNL